MGIYAASFLLRDHMREKNKTAILTTRIDITWELIEEITKYCVYFGTFGFLFSWDIQFINLYSDVNY